LFYLLYGLTLLEELYRIKARVVEEQFMLELEKAITTHDKAKMENCLYRRSCLVKNLGVESTAIIRALCQIHAYGRNTFSIVKHRTPLKAGSFYIDIT